jgi:ABC-type branched-subunit amino acid transport system permease subunit
MSERSRSERESWIVGDEQSIKFSVGQRRISVQSIVKALLLGVLLAVPFIVGPFYTGYFTMALIFAIFAVGVDIIWGYTGVMTFGHAAFFGSGAYIMTILMEEISDLVLASLAGLFLGALIPGALGLVIAGVLFYEDIDDMHFTIFTLAIAIIAEQVAVSWRSVTGGYDGIINIPSLTLGIPYVTGFPITEVNLYYMVVLMTIGIYLLGKRIVSSPFGTTLVAIKDNEEKTKALGYKTRWYKTYSFGIGSAIAGFAGALYAPYSGFVSPTLMGFLLSTNVLLWILIGGRGTIIGPILGAVGLALFENEVSSQFTFSWTLILGIVLVVVILVAPNGIVGLVRKVQEHLRRYLVE